LRLDNFIVMDNIGNVFTNLISNYSPIFKVIFLLKNSKFFKNAKIKSLKDSKLVLVFKDYQSYLLAIQNKQKLLNYLNRYLVSNNVNHIIKEIIILNDVPKKNNSLDSKNKFIFNKKHDKELLKNIGYSNYFKLILNKIRNNIVKRSNKNKANNN